MTKDEEAIQDVLDTVPLPTFEDDYYHSGKDFSLNRCETHVDLRCYGAEFARKWFPTDALYILALDCSPAPRSSIYIEVSRDGLKFLGILDPATAPAAADYLQRWAEAQALAWNELNGEAEG